MRDFLGFLSLLLAAGCPRSIGGRRINRFAKLVKGAGWGAWNLRSRRASLAGPGGGMSAFTAVAG